MDRRDETFAPKTTEELVSLLSQTAQSAAPGESVANLVVVQQECIADEEQLDKLMHATTAALAALDERGGLESIQLHLEWAKASHILDIVRVLKGDGELGLVVSLRYPLDEELYEDLRATDARWEIVDPSPILRTAEAGIQPAAFALGLRRKNYKLGDETFAPKSTEELVCLLMQTAALASTGKYYVSNLEVIQPSEEPRGREVDEELLRKLIRATIEAVRALDKLGKLESVHLHLLWAEASDILDIVDVLKGDSELDVFIALRCPIEEGPVVQAVLNVGSRWANVDPSPILHSAPAGVQAFGFRRTKFSESPGGNIELRLAEKDQLLDEMVNKMRLPLDEQRIANMRDTMSVEEIRTQRDMWINVLQMTERKGHLKPEQEQPQPRS